MPNYSFADFELDSDRFELRRAGKRIPLLPTPFEVLAYLVRNHHRVVSSQELIAQVWGQRALSLSSVPTAIATIRRALADTPRGSRFIKTIPRRGYRFIGTLRPTLSPSSNFVGRTTELSQLNVLASSSLCNGAQLALIAGEPGIGKTRLSLEFASRLEPSEFTVAVAHCQETEGAPPLSPWIDVIQHLEAAIPTPQPSERQRMIGHLLSRSSALLDAPALQSVSSFDRLRLFSAIAEFLATRAQKLPLAIVIDDLHSADTASQHLLSYLHAELPRAPLLLVATCRTYTPAGDRLCRTLFNQAPSLDRVSPIELSGFAPHEIRQFISSAAATQVTDASVAILHEQTQGNPFLLHQVASLPRVTAALHSDGRLPPLPSGVREAVLAELAPLPGSTLVALQTAAIFGRDVPLLPLADSIGTSTVSVLQDLQPAIDRRVLIDHSADAGLLQFRHLLLRDTLYNTISTVDRVASHFRVALALEKYSTRYAPAEIAHHFQNAQMPDCAVDYFLAAGRSAAAHLAYEDAAGYFEAALQSLNACRESIHRRYPEILVSLGEVQFRSGNRVEAKSTLLRAASLARQARDGRLFARAVLGLAPDLLSIEMGVLDPGLISLLEEALELAPEGDAPCRTRLHARLSMALLWAHRREERNHHSTRALEFAQQARDPESLAYALAALHRTCWGISPPDRRSHLAQRLRFVAHESSVPGLAPLAALLNTTSLLELGHIEAADSEILRMAALADELHDPYTRWYVSLLRATRALMEGRFEESRRLAETFLVQGNRVNDINAAHSFGAQLAFHLWELDRQEEAISVVADFVRRFPHVPCWRGFLMHLFVEAGRLDEAKRELLVLTARGLGSIVEDENWRIATIFVGEAAIALGVTDLAEEVYRSLLPFQGTLVVVAHTVLVAGAQDQRLGMLAAALGRWDQATRHFNDAISLTRRSGLIPWLAHTQFAYAETLLQRGRREDDTSAAVALGNAREIARVFGMVRLQRRILELAG